MLLGHPVLFKSLCYVDGRWIHSDSAATIAVQNPADQKVIGHVPMLDRAQIEAAVGTAHRAYESWRWVPQERRSAILLRWYELILRHQHDLAGILSMEQGKPLAESRVFFRSRRWTGVGRGVGSGCQVSGLAVGVSARVPGSYVSGRGQCRVARFLR